MIFYHNCEIVHVKYGNVSCFKYIIINYSSHNYDKVLHNYEIDLLRLKRLSRVTEMSYLPKNYAMFVSWSPKLIPTSAHFSSFDYKQYIG